MVMLMMEGVRWSGSRLVFGKMFGKLVRANWGEREVQG